MTELAFESRTDDPGARDWREPSDASGSDLVVVASRAFLVIAGVFLFFSSVEVFERVDNGRELSGVASVVFLAAIFVGVGGTIHSFRTVTAEGPIVASLAFAVLYPVSGAETAEALVNSGMSFVSVFAAAAGFVAIVQALFQRSWKEQGPHSTAR